MSSRASASEPGVEAPGRERAGLPLAVLLIGLVSVVLLIGTDSLRQRSLVRDARLLRAMSEIGSGVAVAHLWLEEHVSGDEVDVGEIEARLARAVAYAGAMGDAASPLFLGDRGLERRAAALAASLAELRAIADERRLGYERGLEVGIGSVLDVEYDRVFGLALAQAGALEQGLEERMLDEQRRSRRIFLAVVSAWGALVAFAAAGLWSRERGRRRAEAALRRSRLELSRSRKLEAVGREAGGLAHDINNYLAAIRGHCELVALRLEPEDRVARKMASVIRTVDKATALLERLLSVRGRSADETGAADCNRVVAELEPVLRPSLGTRTRVVTRLAEDLWPVALERHRLEQVLANLLVNARDAMPDGGEITVATANRRRAAAGGGEDEWVWLAVTDTGGGIPEEIRDKIFEPLWTTKEAGRGGGYGLATVEGIVREAGGRIEVRSEVGHGSTFEIYLPRHRPRPDVEAPASSSRSSSVHPPDEKMVGESGPRKKLAERGPRENET